MLPQYPLGQHVPMAPNQRVYTPPPQIKQPFTYIDLNKNQKTGVSNLVCHQEKIYFASVITKINKRNVAQNRIIVITNKFLYNIDPEGGAFSFLCSASGSCSLQRKIPLNKIFGATVSVNPTSSQQQFVIHVQNDYDYLFSGATKREKFLKSLLSAHFANSSQPFVLYCRDEADLSKFHTTDDDLYAKVNRRPKDGQILVTSDMAENGIEWIIFNRRNLGNGSSSIQPIHSQRYPQLSGPMYPPPSSFAPSFPHNPQNQGYPSMSNVPQWGSMMSYGHQVPVTMSERPSYYIPEAQQQPEFSAPMTNMNVHYQHHQNVAPVQQAKEVKQVNQGNNDLMAMQVKKQPSNTNANDWSFIPKNILTYNANTNPNAQIQTNFENVYPSGQQQNLTTNNYNGYNYIQNPNVRGPNMY